MKKWQTIAVCCSFFILSGCTVRLVDFTVISTKNVKVPSVAKGARVTGEDCIPVVVIPLGIANMKEAIDRAIESAGPQFDALVDGVVYQEAFAFLVGQICFKVEGTPINTKAAISLNDEQRDNLMLHSRLKGSSPLGS